MSKPVVAIIGRQNVGKSALLNRVAGDRIAIVEDLPGTTRDRVMADVSWQGYQFILADTGGLEIEPGSTVGQGVKQQAQAAMDEADVIIFLADVRDGIVPSDLEIIDMLRRVTKPVVLAVNKADNDQMEAGAAEFYQLGLGEPFAISAYHGRGIARLLDEVVSHLPEAPAEPEPDSDMMKVAIVGRPNVGKSTLLNTLLGEERVIVDDTPGTTRDAIDSLVDFEGESVLLIDTSGIKRRGRLGAGVGRYSAIRAMRAIDRADVALVVLDATELATAQDMHIAGYVQQAAKGIILVINKWDIPEVKDTAECDRYIRGQFRFVSYAPVLYISAKLGQGVDKIMPQVRQIYEERRKRLPTAAVNSIIQQAVAAHGVPRKGSKLLKIRYATQAEVSPPTFVLFVNDPKLVHFSYRRYLENKLRKVCGFAGTPIRFVFKAGGER